MKLSIAIFSAAFAGLLSACSSAPFGYAQDRCTGRANQCQSSCVGLDNPSVRAACMERCYDEENRCYTSGFSSGDASLAEEALIGSKKSEAEKAADYEAWRKKKREEETAEEADVDTPDE